MRLADSIHHVDRLTSQERRHIRHGRLHQSRSRFFGGPGDVRRDQAIARLQERIVGADRLLRDTSMPAPAKRPELSASARSMSTTSSAAGRVDQERRRLDPRQPLAVHQSVRLRRKRTVQADHVGSGEELVDIAPLTESSLRSPLGRTRSTPRPSFRRPGRSRATCRPIRPKPTIPIVLPASS